MTYGARLMVAATVAANKALSPSLPHRVHHQHQSCHGRCPQDPHRRHHHRQLLLPCGQYRVRLLLLPLRCLLWAACWGCLPSWLSPAWAGHRPLCYWGCWTGDQKYGGLRGGTQAQRQHTCRGRDHEVTAWLVCSSNAHTAILPYTAGVGHTDACWSFKQSCITAS
jgi:hypothetical protein